jgi:hypothetical protein
VRHFRQNPPADQHPQSDNAPPPSDEAPP